MKLREETIGWLYTISGLDEKSFPIGIKNVNMKELAVIFPLLLLAISFVFKNFMLSLAFITPVIFIVFYEEKSMDEFQYVYHFVKFYIASLTPKEEKKKSKEKPKKIEIKYKDEITIAVSTLIAVLNVSTFVEIFELKFDYPISLLKILLFAVEAGVAIGLTIAKIIKK
nr:hypothetical protein [Sulfolobus islandicus]